MDIYQISFGWHFDLTNLGNSFVVVVLQYIRYFDFKVFTVVC